ncbi:MAG: hypothetical protein H8D34_05710 [Chloroflexi bacterium]|nr:hypothetical protein [Chloroflexota bacterium]
MKIIAANRVNWRSNSVTSIMTAVIMLIVTAVLAYITPPLGSFLLMCSTVPVLLLAVSAIHWAVREKSGLGFAVPATVAILLIYVALFYTHVPGDPKPLTLDDLAHIRIGFRYEDIAGEIGVGDWLSDAESFTVAYEVEGDMVLLLVFEDGIHLSAATLREITGSVEDRLAENNLIPASAASTVSP